MVVYTQAGESSSIRDDKRRAGWHPVLMTPAAYPTIRIDHEPHGDWEVELPDEGSPVRCRTLHGPAASPIVTLPTGSRSSS